MAAEPGATLQVTTVAAPTLESTEPGAGREASAHGTTESPKTASGTDTPLAAPPNEPGAPAAEPSFFERIESIVDDLAAQLSSAGALTSGAAEPDHEREQAQQSNDGNPFGGSRGNENSAGHGGRGGKGGKGKGGNGQGRGQGQGKGQGNGKGNGHGHGPGIGAAGGRAHMILDRDDRGYLIASSERH